MTDLIKSKINHMNDWNHTLINIIEERSDPLKVEYLATLFFMPMDFRRVDPNYDGREQ